MLTNVRGALCTSHVKFVSYTGKYPCLCSGELKLEIDMNIYTFAPCYRDQVGGCYSERPQENKFQSFWSSGGWLDDDYCAYKGEWVIDVQELPERLRQYAAEIDEVFNKNVEYGCCGGCG